MLGGRQLQISTKFRQKRTRTKKLKRQQKKAQHKHNHVLSRRQLQHVENDTQQEQEKAQIE